MMMKGKTKPMSPTKQVGSFDYIFYRMCQSHRLPARNLSLQKPSHATTNGNREACTAVHTGWGIRASETVSRVLFIDGESEGAEEDEVFPRAVKGSVAAVFECE